MNFGQEMVKCNTAEDCFWELICLPSLELKQGLAIRRELKSKGLQVLELVDVKFQTSPKHLLPILPHRETPPTPNPYPCPSLKGHLGLRGRPASPHSAAPPPHPHQLGTRSPHHGSTEPLKAGLLCWEPKPSTPPQPSPYINLTSILSSEQDCTTLGHLPGKLRVASSLTVQFRILPANLLNKLFNIPINNKLILQDLSILVVSTHPHILDYIMVLTQWLSSSYVKDIPETMPSNAINNLTLFNFLHGTTETVSMNDKLKSARSVGNWHCAGGSSPAFRLCFYFRQPPSRSSLIFSGQ